MPLNQRSSAVQKKRDKGANDQVRAFRKAAREFGCDEDEGHFQAALRTIAKAKIRTPQKPKRRNEPQSR